MQPASSVTVPLRNRWRLLQMLAGGLLALVLGVALGLLPVVRDGSAAATVGAILFGLLLAVVGAFIIGGWWIARGVRALVVDPTGVRWVSDRRPWELPWAELSRVSVRVGYRPIRRTLRPNGKRWSVHLELVLADASYAGRHPQLAHLQKPFVGGGPDRYGVPFAQRRELITPLDEAFGAFGGERYVGVLEDGVLHKAGYQPDQPDPTSPG